MSGPFRRFAAAMVLALPLSAGMAPVAGFAPAPGWAVEPSEVLDDPALEARARQLSRGLRCMVCQNQSIDDSNADLAKDLRVLVRQRLVAGDTNEEVLDYLVSRYGEFVLLQPRFDWQNLALWGTPVAALLAGGGFAFLTVRRRRRRAPERLTDEEEAAIARLAERGE